MILAKAGFVVTDSLSTIHCFKAGPTTAPRYDCLEEAGANYRVPTNSTLYITSMHFTGSGVGANLQILYGDTAIDDGSTSPTSAVVMTEKYKIEATNVPYERFLWVPIPSLKYPHILSAVDAVQATFFGIVV